MPFSNMLVGRVAKTGMCIGTPTCQLAGLCLSYCWSRQGGGEPPLPLCPQCAALPLY